ncbi:MAG: SCP2 sterol-binding domain-containing protein [Myxococcales bacterium]|nr:SCP2 sterol-binding domain-containing protein [Myxococcales bacterium]
MATVPQSATHLFDELVPTALANHPDKAREVNAIYGFKITGDGGGEWTVDLAGEAPNCVKGDTGKAQCTIEVAHEDFTQMFSNPQLGMQLYFQGKLRVTGDPMLATKLQKFFELAGQV